jgi:hypothetical protein
MPSQGSAIPGIAEGKAPEMVCIAPVIASADRRRYSHTVGERTGVGLIGYR